MFKNKYLCKINEYFSSLNCLLIDLPTLGVPNIRLASHKRPSRLIRASLHPTFIIFSSPFDVNPELQVQIAPIDLQCSEDLKFKLLVCHILDFYKNYELPSGRFPNLITHTQLVVTPFGTKHRCEQLISKTKYANSWPRSQLSNHHLSDVFLLSTSIFNSDITSFWDCKQRQMPHW